MINDILIKNGEIIDGTGKKRFKNDILIQNDKIKEIGNFHDEKVDLVIDAKDLVVTPGFIDCHTHLDFFFPSPRHADVLASWAFMGVTTIVGGNCGFSPAPINHTYEKNLKIYWNFALPNDGLEFEWDTMSDYLSFLENVGQAYNVAILTGFNTIRNNVMGFQARPAKKDEIYQMKEMIRQSIIDGSIGLSLGLAYVPGIYSQTDELMEITSVLTEFGVPLVPHTRGLGNNYDKAVEEVIKIAEKNRIPLHLSHHAGGRTETQQIVSKMLKDANDRGVKISCDNIPWGIGPSTAFILVPPILLDGGVDEFYKKLQDPKIREKAGNQMQNFKPKWPNWENEYWTDRLFTDTHIMHGMKLKKNLNYNNKTLKFIADDLGKTPINTFFDLVLEEREGIFFTGRFDTPAADAFMAYLISMPNCSIMTDAIGADFGTNNPVPYGAFTKVLGKWVREEKKFSIEEAIRKMTSLPASQMQIKNRGTIKVGNFADITVFNPKTVGNLSSFEKPRQFSEGIEYVLINGKIVLERGVYNSKALAGKVLRRI